MNIRKFLLTNIHNVLAIAPYLNRRSDAMLPIEEAIIEKLQSGPCRFDDVVTGLPNSAEANYLSPLIGCRGKDEYSFGNSVSRPIRSLSACAAQSSVQQRVRRECNQRREITLRHTKNGENRTVPMSPEVYRVFTELWQERRLDTQRVFLYKERRETGSRTSGCPILGTRRARI